MPPGRYVLRDRHPRVTEWLIRQITSAASLPSATLDSLPRCIAIRYADRMTQLVTRIDAELARSIDRLIADGVAESRSDAVRKGLRALIEQTRRRDTAAAIIAGYTNLPQTDEEVAWADEATIRMIAEEPW